MAKDEDKLRRDFLRQQAGEPLKRAWPNGRMNGEDDGELAVAIALDPVRKVIIMNFGMPVSWVGLDVASARGMIERLAEHIKTLEAAP